VSATWNGAELLTSYNTLAANMSAATYDGNGLRASATTGAGAENFTWSASSELPQLLMDSNNAYIYAKGSSPAEQVNLATGAVTYLVPDLIGSIRGTVNSSGNLTGTTSYDAWGNPETTGGLTAATPFGYAGGYTDPTGLIYLLARYYQPTTGQFISVDPELSATGQPYSYGNADPVDTTDPSGREVFHKRGERCAEEPWRWCDLTMGTPITDEDDGSEDQAIKVTVRTEPFYGSTDIFFYVQFTQADTDHPAGVIMLNAYEINPDGTQVGSDAKEIDHKNYTRKFKLQLRPDQKGKWIEVIYDLAVNCSSCTPNPYDDSEHTNWAHCVSPGYKCKFDKRWIAR
jgi:RHS repeat-associated protein